MNTSKQEPRSGFNFVFNNFKQTLKTENYEVENSINPVYCPGSCHRK